MHADDNTKTTAESLMAHLLNAIRRTANIDTELPFAVYSSIKEQFLLNIPIVKPVLIVVLRGEKHLGDGNGLTCNAGEFIFLSDNPALNMRNIPINKEYCALLIEFDYHDFNGLPIGKSHPKHYYTGHVDLTLANCLQQFVESAHWAPKSLWSLRKREIIELLCHMGHREILLMVGPDKVSHKLHDMFCRQGFDTLTVHSICSQLALSESTLRRKLKSEGATLQEIKDKARWGLGLHLLQTTTHSIATVAQMCGYQSQSRFTERFKWRFGLTPTELRKTKMAD